jgi:glycosyltransferase involved in cell wall biosynthesis
MPARPLRELWRRSDAAPIEWWTGALDVVHGTNFVVPPSKRAVQLLSVHDMTTVRFPQLCTRDTLQYPGLIARAVARGAHIHTDSAFVAAEVIDHFRIEPARVHTIHLGLPSNEIHLEVGSKDCVSPNNQAPYLLAVGTIEPRKDYPSLLEAFGLVASSNPDLRLVIVGQAGWGEEAFDRALLQLPTTLSTRIDRRGFVNESERTALLGGAAMLVYPSVYEGFGLPPLEAMAAGIPVVATAVGSLPEILGKGALLVPPQDPVALADAIQRVLSDSAFRLQLQALGHANVARFTVEAMIEQFATLYRNLGDAT